MAWFMFWLRLMRLGHRGDFVGNHLLHPLRRFDGAVAAPGHDPALDLDIALGGEFQLHVAAFPERRFLVGMPLALQHLFRDRLVEHQLDGEGLVVAGEAVERVALSHAVFIQIRNSIPNPYATRFGGSDPPSPGGRPKAVPPQARFQSLSQCAIAPAVSF